MPLIVTPRGLSQRAELYHQLGSLVSAGVGLIQALETLANKPPSSSFRKPLAKILSTLGQGSSFSDALAPLGRAWLPSFDFALIQAGEATGRLDVAFRLLAEYYRERASLARQVLSDLAYPAFVLHLALLIFPIQWLTRLVWQGDLAGYVLAKAAIFVPCYAAVIVFLYACQGKRSEKWRALLERLVRTIPVLGTARSNLALARLSMALESLIMAGVSIVEAWPLAAAASGSPALKRTVAAWQPLVLAGQTPAEAVKESNEFPDLFTSLYATGEISGQLDETLRRLYRHYQEEGSRKLHAVAQWTPRLVYFIVVLLVAYQIVSFWSGYFSQINELTSWNGF